MRRAAVIAFAALACACSEPAQNAEPAPTAEAAPALTGREAVYEAARGTPEAFVRALYASYAASETPPAAGQDPVYSRMLNAMIGEDSRQRRTLSVDPICQCPPGSAAVTLQSVTIADEQPTTARAQVAFSQGGETRAQTLSLIKEGPLWRVEDIQPEDGRPVSKTLMAVIR